MAKQVVYEPQAYLDDFKWGRAHYHELVREYPGKWVAIVEERVVAAGESIRKIKAKAQKLTGRTHIPVMYVECGSHVY